MISLTIWFILLLIQFCFILVMADWRYVSVHRISDISPGDQIVASCTERKFAFGMMKVVYYHQAIVESIHAGSNTFNVIEKTAVGVDRDVYEMLPGTVWKIHNPDRCFSPSQVIARARSRLDENQYNFTRDNCEHFAEWCVTGRSRSYQIEMLNPFVQYILAYADLKKRK